MPTYSDELYGAELFRRVSDAIGLDAIVVESLGDDPCSLIEKTMHAVACEAAALLWDRERAQMEGKAEAQRISSRRVAALVRISELCVYAEQLRRDGGDPKPEHVAAITRMITADVEDTIEDVAPPETAAAFVRRLHERLLAAGLAQESVSIPTTSTATT